jgi:hypothetical protein
MAAAAMPPMCAVAVTTVVCDGSNTQQKEHMQALSLSSPGEGTSSLQLLPSGMENAYETFIHYAADAITSIVQQRAFHNMRSHL